jgi:transcriptional regulator with XRE-family HTH domain
VARLERGRCRLNELLGDMSPAEFARRMDVTRSAVSRWMADDRDMSYENTVMGARILDCHAEDLYVMIELPRKNKKLSAGW